MPFSICINQDLPVSLYRRNALDVLANQKDEAVRNRSGWQKFIDAIYRFCGAITDEQKISTLYEQVRLPSKTNRTSADFIFEFWQLSERLAGRERKDFLADFRLQIGTNRSGPGIDVTFSLDDADPAHKKTIYFEQGFAPPEELFELTSDSTYQLKTEVINDPAILRNYCIDSLFKVESRKEAIALLNNLPQSKDSRAFQGNILQLEKLVANDKKQQFYQVFQLEVTTARNISTVNICLGGALITAVKFHGEFTLHDRLWNEEKESKFRLKENNELVQSLYISSLDMNAEWYLYPEKENILKQANEPLTTKPTENPLQQIRGDLCRTEEYFPEKARTTGAETRASFRSIVREHLSPDIEKESEEFKTLYQEYSQLNFDDQKELLPAINGEKKDSLREDLLVIKEKFDRLEKKEQKEMKDCFRFLNSNEFKGTDEEFKIALDKLPLKWKALFIASIHQGLKVPLETFIGRIVMSPNGLAWLQKLNESYEYKCTVYEEARSVEIEVERRVDYKPLNVESLLSGIKEPLVAQEVVTAKYTIAFPEDENMVIPINGTPAEGAAINFHEDKLKFSLVILKQDGSAPQDNETVPINNDCLGESCFSYGELERQRVMKNWEQQFSSGSLGLLSFETRVPMET